MEDIVCKHCGLINDYRTERKANNHCAYCNGCGEFIKNIPYAEPALYVGKYKGKPISEIEDIGYLKWALKELGLTRPVREAIEKRIEQFENLAR
jgi:hypothetical protein